MSSFIIGAAHLAAIEYLAALFALYSTAAPLAAERANTDLLKDRQPAEDGSTGGLLLYLRTKHNDVTLLHVLHAAAVHLLDVKCEGAGEAGQGQAGVGVVRDGGGRTAVHIQAVANVSERLVTNHHRIKLL